MPESAADEPLRAERPERAMHPADPGTARSAQSTDGHARVPHGAHGQLRTVSQHVESQLRSVKYEIIVYSTHRRATRPLRGSVSCGSGRSVRVRGCRVHSYLLETHSQCEV